MKEEYYIYMTYQGRNGNLYEFKEKIATIRTTAFNMRTYKKTNPRRQSPLPVKQPLPNL